VIKFVNFRFALFTPPPPLGDFQRGSAHNHGEQGELRGAVGELCAQTAGEARRWDIAQGRREVHARERSARREERAMAGTKGAMSYTTVETLGWRRHREGERG
jgi:hypothetical protein